MIATGLAPIIFTPSFKPLMEPIRNLPIKEGIAFEVMSTAFLAEDLLRILGAACPQGQYE